MLALQGVVGADQAGRHCMTFDVVGGSEVPGVET